ncbi:MAG: hypothetical protein KDJ38_12835, partial [Gammaproteobacteria bacterium]|nr:hypothetical protein [Gammaproteobacteria bacterium]
MTALESIRALIPRVDPIRYRTATAGPRLAMVRLDRLAPFASGNKIFKLQETIDYALRAGFPQLLSFGGAFSNHIHALALTARQAGLESIGIIRGEAQY